MSIIQSIRTLLRSCPFLQDFARDYADYTDAADPTNYGIFPTGETLLWEDMAGNSRWQYHFVLQAVNWTPDDSARIANCEFVERLCQWFYAQSRQITGFVGDVISLTAQNGQFVETSDDSSKGVYQIPCTLIYEKER